MPRKKAKGRPKKKATNVDKNMPKPIEQKRVFTLDDFAPTPFDLVALRSMNAAQRQAVANCAEIMGYVNVTPESRKIALMMKQWFLRHSKTKSNTVPSDDNGMPKKKKLPDPIPRFDHD